MKKTQSKKIIFIFMGQILITSIFTFIYSDLHSEDYSSKPNIILICIDALRSDHLSCYGYKRNTSPNIDKLSKEGIRFTQAIAAGGVTMESVPSILTGTYSLTHQIRDWGHLRNPSIETLAHELSTKDYQCVLWSNHEPIKYLDIKDGFQEIYISSHHEDNDQQLTTNIINWLRKYKSSHFFLYIHYHGPHDPYRPPEPYKSMYVNDKFRGKPKFVPISDPKFDERFWGEGEIPYVMSENNITDPNYYISQYDGAISYTDAQIDLLMDSLKESGLDKNTLIILTADHGEMLSEHSIYFTHKKVYEENIKVPLIIKFPTLFPEGKVISRQISLIDIVPTILEVAGIDKPSYMQGESLTGFIKFSRSYYTKYVFSSSFTSSGTGGNLTLRTEEWKIIYNSGSDTWELYNLKEDPKECHNLAIEKLHKHKFKLLKQKLKNWKKHATSPVPSRKSHPMTEEDIEHLRSIGYLQ